MTQTKTTPDNRPLTEPVAVIGLGGSLFDTFMVVPEFPGEDTKMKAKATLSQCGGPAATALTAVGKLGLPCAFSAPWAMTRPARRCWPILPPMASEPTASRSASAASRHPA